MVHRDYTDPGNIQVRIFDDHLEIWSPGFLPKSLDIKKLFTESRSIPRNKQLVRIFHEFGLIEQWGSGFQRILSACRDNGNPSPQLQEVAGAFVVSFYKNEGISEGISKGINDLRKIIMENPGLRSTQLSRKIKTSVKNIERWINILKQDKKIEYRGSKKTGGYFPL